MTSLRVQSCGPLTGLQDRGRVGWRRFGVAGSGAMDRLALSAANVLVGNPPGSAAVEFTVAGGVFEAVGGAVRLAYAGPPCPLHRDGEVLEPFRSLTLQPGQALTVGALRSGVFGYLAAEGGFALPPMLGSLSLQRRARIGGLAGRGVAAGDRLPLARDAPSPGPERTLPPLPFADDAPVRVVLGPQDDYFVPDVIDAFLASTYTVTEAADRMGYRLAGPRIAHLHGYNIVSDGIVAGSVQVPGAGVPLVMLADCQTTGGYPKIATVITADLRRVAQRRPGEAIRFASVSPGTARAAALERAELERGLAGQAAPLRQGLPPSEELLGHNLAGAAVSAFDVG